MDFPSSVELTAIPRANLKKNGLTPSSLNPVESQNAPGVVLDHGRPGAATLTSEIVGGNRYWKWDWASVPDTAAKWSFSGESTQLAVPSRQQAKTKPDTEPSRDQVLQSMQTFIASIVDTADQPTILAIAQEELQAIASRSAHDSYIGNTIACTLDSANEGRWLVAHPKGDLGNELGLFVNEEGSTTQLSAAHTESTMKFATEILQLCHSPAHPPLQQTNNSTLLYVRLHSSIRIIRIVPSEKTEEPFQATEVAFVSTERFRGRRPMDMAVDQEDWGRMLIVDDRGGVWSWELSLSAYGLEEDLRCIKEANELYEESYRIAYGAQMDTVVCASSSKLELHELKNTSIPMSTVLNAPRASPIIAVEPTACARGSLWSCICTTESIVWLDERRPKQPVLSWVHNRGPDPALTVTACDNGDQACRYLLWSRNSLLITVYTISKTAPARSLRDPYLLAVPRFYHGFAVQSISALPRRNGKMDFIILATNGSLYRLPVIEQNAGVQMPVEFTSPVSSSEVPVAASSEQERKRSQSINFMRVWRDLNADVHAPLCADQPSLEKLVSKTGPILSGIDILAASVVLDDAPRSSFLRTTQTVEDVRDERLEELFDPTASRFDNGKATSYLLATDGRIEDLQNLLDKSFPSHSVKDSIRERQAKASKLLARDLRLAGRIFSLKQVQDEVKPDTQIPATPEDLFARVAEALSLQEAGPPPISFKYLEPNDHASLSNPTLRSLISEWTLGDDPSEYSWNAPNKLSTPVPGSPAVERPTRAMPQSSPFGRPRSPMLLQTQPALGLGRSESLAGLRSTLWPREHASLGRPTAAQSSPTRPDSQSQKGDLPAAQTQVLPGPFGGRVAPKKKPKKRVAGF